MLITGTSDLIQFKLAANTTTTALPFTVDYNNYTSTSVSVLTNNGTSNNTTAVNLVSSPSSNQQNELRYCSILNSDSVSATVTIQVYDGTNTRVVFRAVLASGDLLQYQLEKGWEVIDSTGNKKNFALQTFNSSICGYAGIRPIASTTGISLNNGFYYFLYLGRAEKSYSSIKIAYNMQIGGAGITWAEMAILANKNFYVTEGVPTGAVLDKLVGSVSVATDFAGTGNKTATINTSNIQTGDRLYLLIACSFTTTAPTLRANNVSDSGITSAYSVQTSAAQPVQPSLIYGASTSGGITALTVSTSLTYLIAWQGT